MPRPLILIRAPLCRCVVIAATKSASSAKACFFVRSCASTSCSKTDFNVTTGTTAASGFGVAGADFSQLLFWPVLSWQYRAGGHRIGLAKSEEFLWITVFHWVRKAFAHCRSERLSPYIYVQATCDAKLEEGD